jgi:carboxymethylenebutenolidase
MGDWQTVSVDGSDMNCYVALPEGATQAPAMAVLHGGPGWDETAEKTVDRLACEGIAAIGPDLFHRGAPERVGDGPRSASMRVVNYVADVQGALAHLAAMPEIAGERIGVMGFCMGGQVSYLCAGNIPELNVAVCFYPGFALAPLGSGQDPSPFDFTSGINCPVMVLTGEDDGNPSPADAAKLDAAMTKHGVTHRMHLYPGTAHAFMSEGGNGYREHAATDGWKNCLEWLRLYL